MKALVMLVLLVAVGAAVYVFSGAYDVSASNPDPRWKHWILSRVSDASVAQHSKSVVVPTLGAPEQLALGFRQYDEMCSGCHGTPGAQPSALSRGLNPHAPQFTKGTDLEPQELFWVTKHGIQMTGMPAWGPSHTDAEIWAIVAFVPKLGKMTQAQYETLRREQPPLH